MARFAFAFEIGKYGYTDAVRTWVWGGGGVLYRIGRVLSYAWRRTIVAGLEDMDEHFGGGICGSCVGQWWES